MTYTLFDLTLRVARELGILIDGVATGGTTTTLYDTNDRTEADGYWAKGSLWLWYDAGGLGAAPEGEMSVVTTNTSLLGALMLRNAFTVAPGNGDRYSVARRIGNTTWLDLIIQKVNVALQELGPIPQVDKTTITIASNQTEYTLPIRANQDLRKVYIQTNQDLDDNQWIEIPSWKIEPATPGNAATLILPRQETSSYALKLEYLDYHPEMQVAADALSDHVPIERVVFPAALACLKWRKELNGGDPKFDNEITRLENKVQEAAAKYPILKPSRTERRFLVEWSDSYYRYPGDRNPR